MKLIKMLNLFQSIEFSLSKFDSLSSSFCEAKHLKETLKINAPNSFFQNESNFFYIIFDFSTSFLKLEVEQVGKRRAEIGLRR